MVRWHRLAPVHALYNFRKRRVTGYRLIYIISRSGPHMYNRSDTSDNTSSRSQNAILRSHSRRRPQSLLDCVPSSMSPPSLLSQLAVVVCLTPALRIALWVKSTADPPINASICRSKRSTHGCLVMISTILRLTPRPQFPASGIRTHSRSPSFHLCW